MVCDASFCHGTLGLAHIYQRMFNYTLDKDFALIANYWYSQSLRYTEHKEGKGNFMLWNSIKNKREESISLIDGDSGIALCLLSAVSNTEPSWDSFFLVS